MTLRELTAELESLVQPICRVPPHWCNYICIRLEADRDDYGRLARALEWVRNYATVDGVPGLKSVLTSPNADAGAVGVGAEALGDDESASPEPGRLF